MFVYFILDFKKIYFIFCLFLKMQLGLGCVLFFDFCLVIDFILSYNLKKVFGLVGNKKIFLIVYNTLISNCIFVS